MTAGNGIRDRTVAWGALAAGVLALLLATLLGSAIALLGGEPLGLDSLWLELMIAGRGPVADGLALFLNAFGGGLVGIFVVPVALVLLLLVLRRPRGAVFSIVAALIATLAVQLLKSLFGRARPEDILVQSDFGSFPSGHTANAAVIAMTFAVLFPRVWVWCAGCAYVLLMAWSRSLLGAHWLSDTLGGALVGVGVVLVMWAFCARWLGAERIAAPTGPPAPHKEDSV